MKAIWKGSISFGLVTIPIKIYSAIKAHSLGFTLLHRVCKTPISYERWCAHCKKKIAWEDVIKGIELPDGSYFTITKEKLEELKPEKTDLIDIVEIVDADAVDPIYFDTHYYVAPLKPQEKAFFLFVAALKALKKVAIGRFVLREKEYVTMLHPHYNGLLLSTLNYSYEIRDFSKIEELQVPAIKMEKQELSLAQELIKKLYKKKFDMNKFKDTFAEQLRMRIAHAAKGKKLPKVKKTPVKRKEKTTLLESLRASLKKYPTKQIERRPVAQAKKRR